MQIYKRITDYKHDTAYRLSFNQLAHETFSIDFEEWYQKGFWNERYIPYSFVDGDRVIANVSANLMDLILNGQKRRAIQIGTVMTHPEYRGRGLAAQLMQTVLETYEKDCDLFYLFANQSAMDFYPRFGFKLSQESCYTLNVDLTKTFVDEIRPLHPDHEEDLKLFIDIASRRLPISNIFGVENATNLLLWYFINIFPQDTFYIGDEDLIVIAQQEEEKLIIYDIISAHPVDFTKLLPRIARAKIGQVVFQFTPDRLNVPTVVTDLVPQELYIKTSSVFVEGFKYPLTAQA